MKWRSGEVPEGHTEPDFTGEHLFFTVHRREKDTMVQMLVMHGGEEVGMAEYDLRKLFAKKNLKYSTWLDLKYEGTVIGKLGCCMWFELDVVKDI